MLIHVLAWAAIAQTTLPEDVARFIERRDACDHFRGEEPYDAERRKFLEGQMLKLCVGSDRELAQLKKKYQSNKPVMTKLNGYEAQIEGGAALIAAVPLRAEEPARAAFSGAPGKVWFWQTNLLAGGQGTCVVRFGFDGAALGQPIENLTLVIRVLDKNGIDLGVASLVLAEPLGGAGFARYREASFDGVSKWPLQEHGALSPLCDQRTTLVVETAAGRQSGKAIELVRFGQIELTSFPRINVRVKK